MIMNPPHTRSACQLHSLPPHALGFHQQLAELWTTACGAELAIDANFVEFNTGEVSGLTQAGQLAEIDGTAVGFVLASVQPASGQGWIDAIAVHSSQQRRGVGSQLMSWALTWLTEQGCGQVRLGASLRPFTPGLPVELTSAPFFVQHGFAETNRAWDLAHDLTDYTPVLAPRSQTTVRPATDADLPALEALLARDFSGRWHFEVQEARHLGSRASDFMLLEHEGELAGFTWLTLEDSDRPLNRHYMHRLPRPHGQLGMVGVDSRLRKQGLGSYLVEQGLLRLHELGVAGCVIDWTGLLAFYGQFGFKPFREYRMMHRA